MIKGINETLKHLVFLFLLFLIFTACTHWVPRVNRHGLPEREYVYQAPEDIDDGWKTASLSQEGIDPDKINEMMHEVLTKNSRNIHSILLKC